jgi:AraC family transcriptional regulator, regulatory protein of adaptative response / DNA-3-methyladenine glycosylase II
VSVVRATALASRLADQLGTRLPQPRHGIDRLFPSSAVIAEADLDGLGLTGERAATLRRLTTALASGEVDLGPGADGVTARAALLAVRGIGEWTATYIAMRGLRDPDAFPAGDLGLRHAFANADGGDARALCARAERWRPWRAYATVHLWHRQPTSTEKPT